MNKRTPYEVLIAQKAELCSLPDISDAIWSSVDTGLNELPGTNSNQEAPSMGKPIFFKAFLYFLAAVSIVTVAVLVWSHKADKKQPIPLRPDTPAILPPVNNQNKKEQPVEPTKTQLGKHLHITPDKNFEPSTISSFQQIDSGINRSAIIVPALDSSGKRVIILPVASDSTGAVKKPHGVKGIGNDDYKIVQTKGDSGKLH